MLATEVGGNENELPAPDPLVYVMDGVNAVDVEFWNDQNEPLS